MSKKSWGITNMANIVEFKPGITEEDISKILSASAPHNVVNELRHKLTNYDVKGQSREDKITTWEQGHAVMKVQLESFNHNYLNKFGLTKEQLLDQNDAYLAQKLILNGEQQKGYKLNNDIINRANFSVNSKGLCELQNQQIQSIEKQPKDNGYGYVNVITTQSGSFATQYDSGIKDWKVGDERTITYKPSAYKYPTLWT